MSTQRYTPEFKAEAVRQVVERGYSVAEIAARLGVSTHSLYKWVSAVTPDKSEKQASELLEAKSKILRLRAQMRRIEEERDILKNRLPGAPRPTGLETLRTTLNPLDSGRWLLGG
ncbi:Transposase [compost metagenome]